MDRSRSGAGGAARLAPRRFAAALLAVAMLPLSTTASAQSGGPPPEGDPPPRRHAVLPGLESHQLLVDPSIEWYDRAVAGLATAYPSFVIVQNALHPDWPPLSGFVIGERHVITAHLDEIPAGGSAPRFLVRTVDDAIHEGAQVAAWEAWDFGVIEFPEPLLVPPIEFGDERDLRRGDPVLNIGNPSAAGREGLAIAGVGAFVERVDGFFRGDLSTTAGGSGGPVLDLDGRLVGMSSFGIGIPVVGIDRMRVAELRIRSVVPVDPGPGAAGAAASTIASLTAEYRP